MIKKTLKDTIGISIGSVGISQAHSLPAPWGGVVGTAMSAGILKEVLPREKKRR